MRTLTKKQLVTVVALLLLLGGAAISIILSQQQQKTSTQAANSSGAGGEKIHVSVPETIPTDCSVDVTDKLNTWLGTVPDGAIITLAKDGCYQMSRTFNIANRNNLTIDGNGATLQRKIPTPPNLIPNNPANTTYAHNRHVLIYNSNKIIIRNLKVLGLNTVSDIDPTSAEGQLMFEPAKFGAGSGGKHGEAGFVIIGSDTVALTHVKTDGTYGDGISLGTDNAPLSRNVAVTDAEIDRNGRQGVAMNSIENAVLDNIRILHSHATGFDLEPNGAKSSVKGVEIRNSYINSRTVAFSITGSTAALVANDNIYIHDNMVRYSRAGGWFVGGRGGDYRTTRSNWRITNNTIQNRYRGGIRIVGVTNVTIEGNRQFNVKGKDPAYPGVYLNNVGGKVSIKNNEFIDATAIYKAVSSSAEVSACNNKLTITGSFDRPSVCQ
jgi:hypothetical protein